ncbi:MULTISPECIES: Cthe_2314 family HEPN domain-containing protein [unclassified Caballeronia]|uniref:Cthe_2314 family HEPN domain-containing protein n=1 Tax=unclassified Caballeronia TaxID=2646786 RepID=UPI002027EB49|nr:MULTISPECIES: Cthe_2314 family HEPN domain-containing protein [unclassified Caballeronia]
MIEFEHEIFSVILLDEESPLQKRNLKLSENSRELPIGSEAENYIFACGKGLAVVTAALRKAAYSIEILRNVRQLTLDIPNFTPAEQIGFAIENYLIRSATVYDRVMIFVGKLLDLGIADGSIAHEMIVTNEHVARAGLVQPLKALRKACMSHREERNAIIHHRSYSEEVFDNLAMLHSAQALSVKSGKTAPIDAESVEEFTESFLAVRIGEFEEHLCAVHAAVTTFFDGAISVYRSERQRRISLSN